MTFNDQNATKRDGLDTQFCLLSQDKGKKLIIRVYVDEQIITGSNLGLIKDFKEE